MTQFHTSVLIKEVIENLNIKNNGKYIDATLGGGGHSKAILENGGEVLGIDQDAQAIRYVESQLENNMSKFINKIKIVRGNFSNIEEIATNNGFSKVDAVLYDLGVSSMQLETPIRGFSFRSDGPLDMRMDQSLSVKAADLVNGLNASELEKLFRVYGEEKNAKRYANAIVSYRENRPITSTGELASIIEKESKFKTKIHPATKVFQAIRIAVNDELESFSKSLGSAYKLLNKNGRILVISFHSLEDRIAKNNFRELKISGFGQELTKNPIVASFDEVQVNPRSRSAKLRVFAKN